MLVGAFYFPTDYGIAIDELARELEARGFESLFVCEHTHIPTSRRTPFPGGGELPKRYSHTHDPFVALAFAAAATKRLRLGTGVCLVPQHDPIVTAKAIASLDLLSGGRFEFGIGGGWGPAARRGGAGRARPGEPFHHRVPRPGRRGGAGGLPRRGDRPGAAGSAGCAARCGIGPAGSAGPGRRLGGRAGLRTGARPP